MSLVRWTGIAVALIAVILPDVRVNADDRGAGVALREISDDFDTPVSIVSHPAKAGHILVAERSGSIFSLDTTNGKTQEVLDLEDLIGDLSPRGLLGIAARATDTDPLLFVAYLDPQGDLVVGRFTIPSVKTLDGDSMTVVIKIARMAPNTLGSNLDIGPDGTLYISTGDGEGPALPRSHTSQTPRSLLGKTIRIKPKDPSGYTVPSDNPFVGQTTHHPEIWALGFRSPEAIRFDPSLGRLIILDSNDANNEVNLVERGKNYGWDSIDGTTCIVKDCPANGLSAPIVTIKKTTPESRLIGGILYRGARTTQLQGSIVFAETTTGAIYSVRETPGGTWDYRAVGKAPPGTISALGTDRDGELLIATPTGRIFAVE
jgi:glucose/arabinose dehydrogenase